MPEYLAPGVYIEETSFRAKTIEGVSTSTAGFIGPARYGPVSGEPELITSFAQFERIYGGLDPLEYEGIPQVNFLAHAVRAFFDEGGSRLYVVRVYRGESTAADSGYAALPIGGSPDDNGIELRARYPGAMGDLTVVLTPRVSQNVLVDLAEGSGEVQAAVRGLLPYDLVLISDLTSPIDSPPGSGTLYVAERINDEWRFTDATGASLTLENLTPPENPSDPTSPGDRVQVVTFDLTVNYPGLFTRSETWEGLSFHPDHQNALRRTFGVQPSTRTQQLYVPVIIDVPEDTPAALAAELLLGGAPSGQGRNSPVTYVLDGGSDGLRPEAEQYLGRADTGDLSPAQSSDTPTGLAAFETIPDISIVAAPGSTYNYANGFRAQANQIVRHVISHCERMRYRIAVLDAPDRQSLGEMRAFRGQLASTHAALYYPWVTILDPVSRAELNLPPSGFVSGIYARNDVARGVHKAPANEVLRQAIGFERMLNKAQQDVLNPEGINCLRWFQNRGYLIWGARTMSSDPEWKYVNLRRYFAYLERSIELGTQWVVFEPNGPELWANVRRTIEDFLYNEFQSGHLLGDTPETSYFVRCDRSTMTPNDIDNGRLICLIGVAPLRPAEFVIFRIGQWTADSQQ